jgi:hypothetical protein
MRRFHPLLLLVLLAQVGCYTGRMTTRAARGSEVYAHSGASLLWGLTTVYIAADECPNGLAQAETHFPWWGYIVAPLTVGIVVPIRTEYTCVAGPAPAPVAPAPVAPPPPPSR